MKRFGWLVLLISLGVNLGLGYRLLNPPAPEGPRGGLTRMGNHGRGPHDSGPGRNRPKEGLQSSWRDSSSWNRVMASRLGRLADRLDLTPEQMAVFQATHEENAAGFLAQRRKVNQARDHLNFLIAEGAAAPDSVRLAIQLVGRRQAVLDSLITESILVEMEILDADQRSRYLQFLPVFKDQGQGRRGARGGRFQGN